jgi:hypothetical protein
MSITIPESVLDETFMCPNNFSCLESGQCGDPDKCQVDHADGKNVLYLTSKESRFCSYRVPYGDRQLCTCPTHFAIYQCSGSEKVGQILF